MGVHHFTLYVVPPGSHPVRNPDGTYESSFLLGCHLPEHILQRFRSLLPMPNPWGPVEEFNSSSEWGSDLRIWHEDDGTVDDIIMRYAPCGDSIQLMHNFLGIVKDAGCELLVPTSFEVIPPDLERVIGALRSHRAFRFLSDPETVIKEAAGEIDQNR